MDSFSFASWTWIESFIFLQLFLLPTVQTFYEQLESPTAHLEPVLSDGALAILISVVFPIFGPPGSLVYL